MKVGQVAQSSDQEQFLTINFLILNVILYTCKKWQLQCTLDLKFNVLITKNIIMKIRVVQ